MLIQMPLLWQSNGGIIMNISVINLWKDRYNLKEFSIILSIGEIIILGFSINAVGGGLALLGFVVNIIWG